MLPTLWQLVVLGYVVLAVHGIRSRLVTRDRLWHSRNTAGSKGDHVELCHRSDGARIFHQDWGAGSWESQALLLAGNGYRVIAHDRRGHGRSTQTWDGNERQWGFSDPTHFTRRFRAAHGITPSESTCRNGTGTG